MNTPPIAGGASRDGRLVHFDLNVDALTRWYRWIAPPIVAVLSVLAWDVTVRVFKVPRYFVPSRGAVLYSYVENRGMLWADTKVTAIEIAISFPLAVTAGVIGGVMTVRWRPFQRSIYPVLVAMQSMPTVAAAPLFVVWFGFGLASKVFLAYFTVMIGTITGLRSVSSEEVRLGHAIGLSRLSMFWKIQLPVGLPGIMGGIKVASTLLVIGAVVGEFVGSTAGLGNAILWAQGTIDVAALFAALGLLIVLGVGIYGIVSVIQTRFVWWSTTEGRQA
jgi:NitT/TauT family transport system permease protein